MQVDLNDEREAIAPRQAAIDLGIAVLEGRGNGTYAEAETAIHLLIDALNVSEVTDFGSADEARAISNGLLPNAYGQPAADAILALRTKEPSRG